MECYTAIKKTNLVYVYMAWEDVHDAVMRKKQVCRVLRMIYIPIIFLKGQNPTYVGICLCEPSEQLEGYIPGINSVFSCGSSGAEWERNLFVFSTSHFCVDWFASMSML